MVELLITFHEDRRRTRQVAELLDWVLRSEGYTRDEEVSALVSRTSDLRYTVDGRTFLITVEEL